MAAPARIGHCGRAGAAWWVSVGSRHPRDPPTPRGLVWLVISRSKDPPTPLVSTLAESGVKRTLSDRVSVSVKVRVRVSACGALEVPQPRRAIPEGPMPAGYGATLVRRERYFTQ